MGCGSVLGDLFYLADSLLQPPSPGAISASRQAIPAKSDGENLRSQLYNMYGEGRLSEQVFTALRSLADRGQLRQADLAVHQARTRRHHPVRKDREVANALRGIRSRLAQLMEVRAGSERILSDLEARLAEVEERMTAKKKAARQAVGEGNEKAARLRLMEKADLSDSRQRLLSQAQALRDDLARLADLQAQLEAKSSELEAVSARGELAELSATMNEPEVGA